jgi:hypothetical protein
VLLTGEDTTTLITVLHLKQFNPSLKITAYINNSQLKKTFASVFMFLHTSHMRITPYFALITVMIALAFTSCAKDNPTSSTQSTDSTQTPTVAPYQGSCGFNLSKVFINDTASVSNLTFNQRASMSAMHLVANGIDQTNIKFSAWDEPNHDFMYDVKLSIPGNKTGTYKWGSGSSIALTINNSTVYGMGEGTTTFTELTINPLTPFGNTVIGEFSGILVAPNKQRVAIHGKLSGCY